MLYSELRRGGRAVSGRRALCPIVFIGFALLADFAASAFRPDERNGSEIVAETVALEFGYPVTVRFEIRSGALAAEWENDDDDDDDDVTPAPRSRRRRRRRRRWRRRRADGTTVTDYMSTYYAQRKAVMDKYNSQQREISERLERTKSLIAAKQRLKESKAREDEDEDEAEAEDVTRDRDVSPTSVASLAEPGSTTEPNPSSPFDFEEAEKRDSTDPRPIEAPTVDSGTSNATATATARPTPAGRWTPLFHPTDATASDNFTRDHATDRTSDGNDVGTGEIPEVNFLPQDEVEPGYTGASFPARGGDNETLIIDLGGRLTDHPWRNDSASAELDKMFLWDVDADEERLNRSNGTAAAERGEDPDPRPEVSVPSARVETTPEVHVTRNVHRSSTTTWRNLTHEIVEVNGNVTDARRIDDAPSAGVDHPSGEANSTIASDGEPGEVFGGASESEWCEECPHDYRWGDCEGTLFYQHNIFLRNRGPSAIDAVFGMEVQGPVEVTCVEALRFNQTRGIVTLHSGGRGHDFAKLRIRGFQGEGFSYIMKVWGVKGDEYAVGTTRYPEK